VLLDYKESTTDARNRTFKATAVSAMEDLV